MFSSFEPCRLTHSTQYIQVKGSNEDMDQSVRDVSADVKYWYGFKPQGNALHTVSSLQTISTKVNSKNIDVDFFNNVDEGNSRKYHGSTSLNTNYANKFSGGSF